MRAQIVTLHKKIHLPRLCRSLIQACRRLVGVVECCWTVDFLYEGLNSPQGFGCSLVLHLSATAGFKCNNMLHRAPLTKCVNRI